MEFTTFQKMKKYKTEILELSALGVSALNLAKRYKVHRHTIAALLRKNNAVKGSNL